MRILLPCPLQPLSAGRSAASIGAPSRLAGCASHALARDRILATVNRYRRRRQLVPWSEVKRAIQSVPLGRLSNDYAHAAKSINLGKELAEVAPRSRLRRDIQKLAKAIHAATTNGRKLEEVW